MPGESLQFKEGQIATRRWGELDVTAYINAGGRGTRLSSIFTPDPNFGISKALLEVGSPPVKLVDHHINRMSKAPVRNIVVGAGDLADVSSHVNRKYARDSRVDAVDSRIHTQLGTGGDLILAVRGNPELFGRSIFIKNVDTILDIDSAAFISFHQVARSSLTIALTRRRGVPNEDAFFVDMDGRVVYSRESKYNPAAEVEVQSLAARKGSSTGALVVGTDFIKDIDWEPKQGQISLYKDIVGEALMRGTMAAYDNGSNFFLDVGTASAWTEAEETGSLQDYLEYEDEEAA